MSQARCPTRFQSNETNIGSRAISIQAVAIVGGLLGGLKTKRPERGAVSDTLAGQKYANENRLRRNLVISRGCSSGDNPEFGRFGNRTHMVALAFHLDDAIVRHGLEGAR